MNQEKTFLTKEEQQEAINNFNQKLAEDLKEQKEDEEENGELTPQRRRWFNKQIKKYSNSD